LCEKGGGILTHIENIIGDEGSGVPKALGDELCTPPTIARLLGVSPPTVYARLHQKLNGIPHIKTPGGQLRVRRRDVLAYCHQQGLKVPAGLLPLRPEVFVFHPDLDKANHIKALLAPRCRVRVFTDPIDGLLALGELRPPLVVISKHAGFGIIQRLCDAIRNSPEVGYSAVILLNSASVRTWRGGSVPLPLSIVEPDDIRHSAELGGIVNHLLGLDS
jgi:excisionase family DNA binding protein